MSEPYFRPQVVDRVVLRDELLKVREVGLGTPALEQLIYNHEISLLPAYAVRLEGSYQSGDDIAPSVAIAAVNAVIPKVIAALPDDWPVPNPALVPSGTTVRELAALLFRIAEATRGLTPAEARRVAQKKSNIAASSSWRETWEKNTICEAIANTLIFLREQRRSLLMDTAFDLWVRGLDVARVLSDLHTHEYLREAMIRFSDTINDEVRSSTGSSGSEVALRALWHYASMSLYAYQAREENVMLWVMAAWGVTEYDMYALAGPGGMPPFDPRDISALRQFLRESPHLELDEFLRRVEAVNDHNEGLLAKWRSWIVSCDCATSESVSTCRVHGIADDIARASVQYGYQLNALFMRVYQMLTPPDVQLTASNVQPRDVEKMPQL